MNLIKDYESALTWMNQQKSSVTRQGLEKIYYALSLLGNPHQSLTTIHIGGTNGKGSTTAFLKSLFQTHGIKTGTFTSPHISRFNERITFNGKDISDQEVIDLVNQLIPINEQMAQSPYSRLGFFELYTVMMFVYFARVQPDVCLIEVGLGGRFDSTNVIKSPYTVITSIGLDHTEKLGSSLEAIASQKAGIIHEQSQVYLGEMADSARAVIEDHAQKVGAVINQVDKASFIRSSIGQGTRFLWHDTAYEIPLLGQHQLNNVSLALSVFCQWMQDKGYPIDSDKIKLALNQTFWPGRLEKISDQPFILLDGAHNLQGIEALGKAIQEYFDDRPIHLFYAGLSRKNQKDQVAYLFQLDLASLTFTSFNHPQAMTVEDFRLLMEDQVAPDYELHFETDWTKILNNLSKDKTYLVTGSLYFIAQVRDYILARKNG